MDKNLIKRKGIIKMTEEFIYDEPEILRFVLKEIGFIPLRILPDPMSRVTDYAGLSEKFEIIEDGEQLPIYKVKISTSENSKNPGKIEKVEVTREEY